MADRAQKTQYHKANSLVKPAKVQPMPAPRAGHERIIHLQRTAGNSAVNRMIQRKLTVGAANDPLEREADRVADRVVSGASNAASASSAGGHDVRRNAAEEDELQAKRIDISRAPQEEDELMTKRADRLNAFDAGPAFETQLRSAGGGKPLDPNTRSEMERGIGADFGDVRVHTGAQASHLNRSISAQAFTRGSDVFFDSGKYNPSSAGGKRLLAHELTHVVQQGGAAQSDATQRKTSGKHTAYGATVQRALDEQQQEKWQEHITEKIIAAQNARRTTENNDPATSQLNQLIRYSTNLSYTLMAVPAANDNHLANVSSLYDNMANMAMLGQGAGYAKTGTLEKKTTGLKNAAFKQVAFDSLFRHTESVYKKSDDGAAYNEKLDSDHYGKRTGFHLLGALANIAFPVSLLGLLGGSAALKLRALSTRSTERLMQANSAYQNPLANFRSALGNIRAVEPAHNQLATDAGKVENQLEVFLKKRKAQHEKVNEGNNQSTAEDLSQGWLTGRTLKSLLSLKYYGPGGPERMRKDKAKKKERKKKREENL